MPVIGVTLLLELCLPVPLSAQCRFPLPFLDQPEPSHLPGNRNFTLEGLPTVGPYHFFPAWELAGCHLSTPCRGIQL